MVKAMGAAMIDSIRRCRLEINAVTHWRDLGGWVELDELRLSIPVSPAACWPTSPGTIIAAAEPLVAVLIIDGVLAVHAPVRASACAWRMRRDLGEGGQEDATM